MGEERDPKTWEKLVTSYVDGPKYRKLYIVSINQELILNIFRVNQTAIFFIVSYLFTIV